ncbi:hypothetical protein GGR52DRAFT_574685 [Hypoxylon sp. FL1284]|nr:hypothetical protein GGR52DRAFT_574685 [Hypoxylon sp. FL1284]
MAQLDLDVLPSAETRESADEFINRLSDNGLSSMNAEMREMIKSELEANYDELYARPGHFLYELLQNADDVNYEDPDPEPALCITTENPFDSVRFDCNETGFTRRNVRAICRSRMSTKMGEVGTTGEKGIGFKSVFAVSKTASIASGPYRFRLDKSQEFGVICPTVWDADVPDDLAVERQKGSVLVLEIDQNEKAREEVRSMIRGFRPDTMLFLRQLKRLEISTYPPLSPVIFRRQEILDEDGTTHLTIQQDERCRSCFKVFEKSVYGLKPRRRYPKVKESKIKLAFPVDPKFEHAVASSLMQVYTFLPVSEYGLGFTLQAEFVLTSSREDIQPLVDWNDGLLEAIPGIFCEAIHLLNPTCLRFSWPIFLSLSEPKGFFKDVRKKIIAKLNQERVLQVEDKTKPLSVPSAVTIVPDKYKLKGLPLVRSEAALSRYLSHKYLESCIPYLRYAMGIKELDTDSFIRDLQDYVNDESSSSTVLDGEDKDVPFRAQSLEWHSRVASILKKHTWHSRVKAMNMIPLNDGETWVAATSEDKASIFFQPQESQQHDLLDGINIRFVHPDIMSEENMQRYQLFEALGVEKYDSTKLCKLVEAAHKDRLIPEIGENPSPNTLISHALFLFRNSHTPSVDLWVATEAGKQSRASATYFESIGRPVQGWECPVLHPDYYTCVKDEHELRRWRSWLDNELGVRKYLRLVNVFPRLAASPIHNKFNISQEMECILADTVNWRPYDILTLLYSHWDNEHCTDEHWAHYHSFFKYDIRWDYDSVFTLRRRISELQVYCLGPDGGVLRNLEGTILPSDSLGGNYENAPIFILDVKGDKSERVQGIRWHFLEIFGVKLDLDLDDCIACLKKLRDKIRDLFNSEALIYIPQYRAKYAKLKNRNVISHHYGRHETLFLHVARVQATIEISDVLSEIEFNAIAYSSEDLYGILRELNEFIKDIKEDSDPSRQKSRRSDSDLFDWLVESDGSTHKSSTYESSVVVMFHGRTLKIYMPAKFTEQHALPPLDLAYDLGALLGIPAENSALVEQILTRVWEQDTTEIEKVLTRRKLKFDFPNEGQIQDHFEEEPSEEPSEEEPPEEHRSITETQQNDQANSAKMHVERIAIRPKKEDSGPIKDVKSEVQDEDIGSVTIADEKKDDRGQKEEFFESEETDNVKEDEAERIAINSLQGDLSITSGMSDGPQMTLSNSENWSNDLVKSSEDSNEDDEDPLKLFQMVHKSLDVSLVQGSTSLSVKQKSIPDVEEGHFRIETSTPLISKEELLYFRPRISSPTPSDDGEPDESDYSTDDVDSPLPGAQPASRSQDVKPADSKLPSPTAKNEHQAQKQAPAKLTITSSKSARSPLSKEMSLLQMRQFVSPLRNATPNERVDRQYNVRRFQRTGLFRPSGPTNIVYVNDFNDMPVESKSNDPQILATLQARMQVFKDNRTRTVFALIPTIVNEEDTELAFLGQAWVW